MGTATARDSIGGRLPGLLVAALLSLPAACDDGASGPGDRVVRSFDLTTGDRGWAGDFADYPVSEAEDMGLVVERRPLPSSVEREGEAFFIAGTNTSDDLFMFLARPLEGLERASRYAVDFRVTFASDAPSDCAGIGGAPGEAVTMKAGAVDVAPVPIVEERPEPASDFWRMNVDKGNQSDGGSVTTVLGDVANGSPECTGTPYRLKTLESPTPVTVTTDGEGRLWLLVGTDSGFEGRTGLFYLEIRVTLEPR